MKKTKSLWLIAITTLCCIACSNTQNTQNNTSELYTYNVADKQGNMVSLNKYKGNVMLIVNTATHCGFTPQYTELEQMYEKYSDRGFVILDFPCNQFGNQAPESDDEISAFCQLNYKTKFPQFRKIDVNGANADSLFVYLKSKQPFKGFDPNHKIGKILIDMLSKADPNYDKNDDIKWNFTKFLINRDGDVVDRFEPTESAENIEKRISEIL